MQRYNIDRDGDLKKAENGYVYLASEVDALIAEHQSLFDYAARDRNKLCARIAELEERNHDLASALRELLQDTQHVGHDCESGPDYCPVKRAREVLEESSRL